MARKRKSAFEAGFDETFVATSKETFRQTLSSILSKPSGDEAADIKALRKAKLVLTKSQAEEAKRQGTPEAVARREASAKTIQEGREKDLELDELKRQKAEFNVTLLGDPNNPQERKAMRKRLQSLESARKGMQGIMSRSIDPNEFNRATQEINILRQKLGEPSAAELLSRSKKGGAPQSPPEVIKRNDIDARGLTVLPAGTILNGKKIKRPVLIDSDRNFAGFPQ